MPGGSTVVTGVAATGAAVRPRKRGSSSDRATGTTAVTGYTPPPAKTASTSVSATVATAVTAVHAGQVSAGAAGAAAAYSGGLAETKGPAAIFRGRVMSMVLTRRGEEASLRWLGTELVLTAVPGGAP